VTDRADGLAGGVERSLNTALRSGDGSIQPSALLWTDPDGQWRPLIASLRNLVPHLYTFGEFDVAQLTGPAIWLRCIVDRSLPEAPSEEVTPILYLPNVSRQQLRSGPDCPQHLRPLVELQFRGAMWHQRNGRDWTVEAFLVSEDGVGLEIAGDTATRLAVQRALPLLSDADLDALRGRRLDADDFDRLAVSDPVRDMLRWISDPDGFRRAIDEGRWQSFCRLAAGEFDFDPDAELPTGAAARVAEADRRWDPVWNRFRESPRLYPGVVKALRERPAGGKLILDTSRDPRVNDSAEERLRKSLVDLTSLPHRDACERLLVLESEDGKRRQTPWAELAQAPLAVVLEPLARLASLSRSTLGGTTLEALSNEYATDGWRCDRAALDALALSGPTAHAQLIERVVAVIYAPWADHSARRFQELVENTRRERSDIVKDAPIETDLCYLFVDGLRYDVGVALQEKLESRDFIVRRSHRLAPLPTVTSTAKPVAAPLPGVFAGGEYGDDFTPLVASTKQPAVTNRFRSELDRAGVEVLDADDNRGPAVKEARAWAEAGDIDPLGHSLQGRLAEHLDRELERIADRASALMSAGWKSVKIVTDHGWLFLPGGLPKFELPTHLVASKWSRCATVRGHSSPDVPVYPWFWNESVRIASPPGIACFSANNEYAHGGVSPQECVIPELLVTRAAPMTSARIIDVRWMGFRCRISTSDATGIVADIRRKAKDKTTTITASEKEIPATGEVSLVVSDEHEGISASVVLLDAQGRVLDQKLTTVGEIA
jgi:hypothetical protein